MEIMNGAFTGDAEFSQDSDYAITVVFIATWNGACTLDKWHKIKRGDTIGRPVHSSNPFVPIQGYACQACVHSYPRYTDS